MKHLIHSKHAPARRRFLYAGAGGFAALATLSFNRHADAAGVDPTHLLCSGPAGSIPDLVGRAVGEQLFITHHPLFAATSSWRLCAHIDRQSGTWPAVGGGCRIWNRRLPRPYRAKPAKIFCTSSFASMAARKASTSSSSSALRLAGATGFFAL